MYQGHMNDGSSIQKHSAGPLYPFVVYETHDGRTHVMHPEGASVVVENRDAAERLVVWARYHASMWKLPLHRALINAAKD